MRLILSIFCVITFGYSLASNAYPEFISYGYTSCLTCHFNGAGGGPLNDYGRGLFAIEIAAKPFFQSKLSDDELGRISGFLGSSPVPFGLKPYAKLRYLEMDNNIDKPPLKADREILMQAAVGMTYSVDSAQKYLFSFETGYVPKPVAADPAKVDQNREWISREYYFRLRNAKQSWLYFGLLDKVFGIRTPDHSSYSRGYIGLGQNDQAHGVLWHKGFAESEIFLFGYLGNLLQESDIRTKGATFMYEQRSSNDRRWGASMMYQTNSYAKQIRISHHQKMAIEKGSALLFEFGAFNDTSVSTSAKSEGIYSTLNSTLNLTRGFNFTTQLEYLNDNLKENNNHKTRAGIGLLIFPMQRVEIRTSIVNSKSYSPTKANEDTIAWLGQVHLSF